MIAPSIFRGVIDTAASNLPLLLGTAARASIVLVCAAAITALMRRASAASRHVVWVSAILVALTLPLVSHYAPVWNARVLPRVAVVSTDDQKPVHFEITPALPPPALAALRSPAEPAVDGGSSVTINDAPVSKSPATQRTDISTAQWIAIIWIAGAIAVLARLALGTLIVWRTARRAEHVEDADWVMLAHRTARDLGITRPITLLASERQTVPVTWGVVYPVVLLPLSALAWAHDRREAVLVHELAHVGRLDALTQTIVQLALAAFWFNPLVWIAAKRVRTERERACDDLVLSHGTRASFYADDLLSMVRTLTRNTEPAFAALAMARRSEFEGRMLAILDPRIDRRTLGKRGALVAAAASLAIALPLAALRPLPREIPVERTADTKSQQRPADRATAVANAIGTLSGRIDSNVAKLKSMVSPVVSVANCNMTGGHHMSVHSDDDQSTFVYSDDKTCLMVASHGKITYSDDDSRIQSISSGGHISITELTNGITRRYDAVSQGGSIVGSYFVNDKPADLASSEAWLATVIQRLVREDASQAAVRVARIRRQRGVAGVLQEIDLVQGDYAKRAYLDALVEEGNITSDTLRMITQVGVRSLSGDYDKSEFLKHASHAGAGDNSDLVATAARSMSSDYYKHQLLSTALMSAKDKDAIARQIIAGTSDMSSDYDREGLFLDVLGKVKLSEASLVTLITSSEKISSDYYRAVVLDSLVGTQSIAPKSVYTALLKSASGISGDYYRAAVLKRIAERHDLTPDIATATLTSTQTMSSDNDKANVLVAVSQSPVIRNAGVRDAYLAAAKTIKSGSDYRRATSAILP